MELKEKLVTLRKEKGLTQLAVAEKLGVSRQAISRWESGTALPSTDNIRCLSALYEVPIDYLLKEDSERKSDPDNETVPDELQHKNKKTVAIIAAALVGILAIGITELKKLLFRILLILIILKQLCRGLDGFQLIRARWERQANIRNCLRQKKETLNLKKE